MAYVTSCFQGQGEALPIWGTVHSAVGAFSFSKDQACDLHTSRLEARCNPSTPPYLACSRFQRLGRYRYVMVLAKPRVNLENDCLPSLTPANLCKLDSSDGDRDRSLLFFVHSQAGFLSSYALEGKQLMASWIQTNDSDAAPKTSPKDFELESGFGTPLLKPRVPVREDGGRSGRKPKNDVIALSERAASHTSDDTVSFRGSCKELKEKKMPGKCSS